MATNVKPRQLSPAQMADLAGMMDILVRDERTRPYMAHLTSAMFPDRAAAFKDVQADAKIAALEKRINDREYQRQVRAQDNFSERERRKLVEGGYTDEQTKDIKAVMDRYGMSDWKAGSVLYQHETKPVDVPASRPTRRTSTWEFPTVEGPDGKQMAFKDFLADPVTAAQNAAYQVIEEFKRAKGIPLR